MLNEFLSNEEGQSTTEYMLLLSVIVVSIVAAAYAFYPLFQSGVSDLGGDVSTMLGEGKIGNLGDRGN